MTARLPESQLKRKRGGRFDGPLLAQCYAAIKDCPRTVGEIAKLLGVEPHQVSKAMVKLVGRKKVVVMEDRDPDTGKSVYEELL